MAKVLNVKEDGVTRGVIDKGLQFFSDLREVTFADIFGAIHSVHAHKNGPFQTVDDILKAHEDGTLHTFESHDQAITYLRDTGDNVTADRLAELRDSETSTQNAKGDDE